MKRVKTGVFSALANSALEYGLAHALEYELAHDLANELANETFTYADLFSAV